MPYRRRRRRASLRLAPAVDRPPARLPAADPVVVRQVVVAVVIGALGALAFGAAVFGAGRRTGTWLGPLLLAGLAPVAVGLQVFAFRRSRGGRLDWANFVASQAVCWLLAVGGVFAYGLAAGTPKAVFARVVGQPMPRSAREFKWRRDSAESAVAMITFKAEHADVEQFVAQAGLQPIAGLLDAVGERSDLPPAVAANQFLSNLCLRTGLPFEPLPAPVYYAPSNGAAAAWQGRLFTDPAAGRVYLFR